MTGPAVSRRHAGGRLAGPAAGAGAVLAAAALWGSTGTVAHYAPPGVSALSVGAARVVLAGPALVLVALAARARDAAGGRSAGPRRLGGTRLGRRAPLALGAIAVAGVFGWLL